MVGVVATGETAIIIDEGRKVGDQEAAFIKFESCRTIVPAGDWIVEDDGVGAVILSDCDLVQILFFGV